jgi:hypothetical protein
MDSVVRWQLTRMHAAVFISGMHVPMIDRAHNGLLRIIAANDWRERPRNATFQAAAQNVLACSPTGQCSRAAPETSSRSPLL